jgi:hypothetical protein
MYDEQESRDEAAASMQMDSDQFDAAMERNELDSEYSDYLILKSDARIYNGDSLLAAMESGDYYDDFKEDYLGEKK